MSTLNFAGESAVATVKSAVTSTSPRSHSFRSAYISIVIAVQLARDAASSSVGLGP
jgi:hypothetical protein